MPTERRKSGAPPREPPTSETSAGLTRGGDAPVVGIGVSAGGLEAVGAFFAAMPADSGISFLVVPHLDPDHHSHFAELIAQKTAMPVAEAIDGERLEADRVYVIPPGRTLTLSQYRMRVVEPAEPRGHRHPVDALFRSLAVEHGQRAVGIVLSGTGSDGTSGLREIQGRGGLAIAQTPATAGFDGMPRSAIDAGVVDHVLAPTAMPELLLGYARHPYLRHGDGDPTPEDLAPDETLLDTVVALLQKGTRHDFRGYRRPTLMRRLHRRMGLTHAERLSDYVELLRERPGELEALGQDLLIRVTGFFRDPQTWEALGSLVIEPLVAERPRDTPIRAWVPGCATGEEAYSLAMLLTQHLESASAPVDVRVFATDVSESAVARARDGLYAEALLEGLTPERRKRFFNQEERGFRVREELRDRVVFATHDLLGDPPFSRLDLITCRNVLIYLEPEVQRRLLAILHLALVRGGHLLLGSAESVGPRDELFEKVSKKHRIFRRVGPTRHDLVSFTGIHHPRGGSAESATAAMPRHPPWAGIASDALAARFGPAAVLVDRRGQVRYFHGDTDRYLTQPAGEDTRDLVALARKGLGAPLRRVLHRAGAEGSEATASAALVWGRPDIDPVTITASAVESRDEIPGMLLVTFEERPSANAGASVEREEGGGLPEPELERELAATREDLRRTVEDAEAGNEELKAANEELTSMNEELQSTNEELETSKEELQSLNEELRTVNTQLEHKVNELEEATSDLKNLLASTEQATLFLDRELRIRRFTAATVDLLAVIPSDVGRPLRQLAATAATEGLSEDAEEVLETLTPRETEIAAGERWYLRRVLPYRSRGDRIEGVVAIFTDITATRRAGEEARAARDYAQAIVATVREPLVVLTPELEVRSANAAFYRAFGLSPDVAEGRSLFELDGGQWGNSRLRELLGEMLPRESSLEGLEVELDIGGLGRRTLLLNAARVEEYELVLLAMEDVTERKHHEGELRFARDRAELAVGARERFLAALSHELRTPLSPVLAIVSSLREEAARGTVTPAKVAADLARVMRNLEHEVRLIDDLLDLSRIESGRLDLEPREVDLTVLAAQAAEVLSPEGLAAAGLTLALDLPERPETAWADPDRLAQVLHNLLRNAEKFTPQGGTITVRLRRADDGALEVEVADTGIGIAPDEVVALFDRFGPIHAPARESPGGLGLGLSIARGIVQQHGGDLVADSPGLGRGSTFTVRLPPLAERRHQLDGEDRGAAAEPRRGPRAPAPAPPAKRPLPAEGPLRVLLVEDHRDSREAFAELLADMGNEVVAAAFVAEALAMAAKHCADDGAGLDLVICDVGLPDGSGVELMRELIERHGVAGIALTGYGMDSDIRASLEAGFAAHLTKPVDVAKLRSAIQSLRAR